MYKTPTHVGVLYIIELKNARWNSEISISLLSHVNKNVVVWEFLPVCGPQSVAYCWLSVNADVQETRMTTIQV